MPDGLKIILYPVIGMFLIAVLLHGFKVDIPEANAELKSPNTTALERAAVAEEKQAKELEKIRRLLEKRLK